MKRMVERVGIGDTGYSLSGTLQVAPLNADDVGVVILGSQKGTQTANYLEIRDSTGAALISADANGALYAASFVGTMEIEVGEVLGVVTLNAHAVSAVVLSGIKVEVDAVTATTLCGTNVHSSVLTADVIDMSAGTIKKIKTTTITATTASGFTNLYTTTLTATTANVATVNGTTVSGSTLWAELVYVNVAPGKIGTITITATTASGFTSLFTDVLTASRIDAVTAGTAMKIGTTTITGTTASGFTSIYGQTLTATT